MPDKPAQLAPTRHRWVIPVIWIYILAWTILQLLAVFPLPAHSDPNDRNQPQPYVQEPRGHIIADPTPTDPWFARIEVLNISGTYNEIEVHQTIHRIVLLEYVTTRPNKVGDPNSADSACVVDLPAEVIAQPPCVTIMEQERESIFLLRFIGG